MRNEVPNPFSEFQFQDSRDVASEHTQPFELVDAKRNPIPITVTR